MARFYIGKLLELDRYILPTGYNELDDELKKYGLMRNRLKVTGARVNLSARRQDEPEGTKRYQIDEYRGSSSDFGRATSYWVVGKLVEFVQASPDVLEKKIPDLEKIIGEVRQDIPDASLILADI